MSLDQYVSVATPEGVSFRLPLAGPTVRALAMLFDLIVIMALNGLVSSVFGVFSFVSSDLTGFLIILAQFLLSVGYGIVTEWLLDGQTWGKKICKIRVMDERGLPLTFHQILLRNVMRPIDMLPLFYLVGCISCAFSRHFKRLGDHVAGTVVVLADSIEKVDVSQITFPKYNSLKEAPHLAVRLRQAIPPALAALALESLNRAKHLDPAARLELFNVIATAIKDRCELPEESVADIPDESLVLNVVAVLYQERG